MNVVSWPETITTIHACMHTCIMVIVSGLILSRANLSDLWPYACT